MHQRGIARPLRWRVLGAQPQVVPRRPAHELGGFLGQGRHRGHALLQPEACGVQPLADQAVVHQGRQAPARTADLRGALDLRVEVGGREGPLFRGRAVDHRQGRAEFVVHHVEELALVLAQLALAVQCRLQRILGAQQLGGALSHPLLQRLLRLFQRLDQLGALRHRLAEAFQQVGPDGDRDQDVQQQGHELPVGARIDLGGQQAHGGCRHIAAHHGVQAVGRCQQQVHSRRAALTQLVPRHPGAQHAGEPRHRDGESRERRIAIQGMLAIASSGAMASASSAVSTRRQRVPRVSSSRTCHAKVAGRMNTPTLTSRSDQCDR